MSDTSAASETLSSPETKPAPANGTMRVYVGTYTGPKSKGIYLFDLDMTTGKMTPQGLAAETPSPSFVAIHPNRKFLYVVNEISQFNGEQAGSVSAFSINAQTGKLTLLNQQSSRGTSPCHLSLDKTGKHVLVANYSSGSVSVLPIEKDGKLGKDTCFVQHKGTGPDGSRQEGPHAHYIQTDAANRFVFAADLGLDKVLIYRFDPKSGVLTPNSPAAGTVPPGGGPRHFAIHPNNRFAYVCNEMTSTVTAFGYDARTGTLTTKQTVSTLPKDWTGSGNSTAEMQIHPNGKFLYVSNRGHDSLAIFSINPSNGALTLIGNESTQGRTPRNFEIDPSGTWLLAANQDSDTILVFRVNGQTGQLTPTERVEAPSPVCVQMMPLGR